MNFQIPVFKTRRALLVIDLQNEFVSETGRCRVIQPNFVDNVINLITEFRKEGGEVIWTRTEYKAHRKLQDVQLVLAEPDSLYTTRDTIEADAYAKVPSVPAMIKEEEEEEEEHDGKANGSKGRGRSNSNGSPESTKLEAGDPPTPAPSDAFLSIHNTILCEKDSPASTFVSALTPEVKRKSDRVITKTWYSAFTDTNLLMMLQGRLVTEVYICGAMTNTSVYATALDAVKFGLKVYIPNDCCGYRHIAAHQDAVAEMTGKLGVESMLSRILVKTWENQRNNGNESSTTVRTVDTSQLQTVVENAIRAGEGGVVLPDPDSDLGTESEWDCRKKKVKGISHPVDVRKEPRTAERVARITAAHHDLPNHLDTINQLLALKGESPTTKDRPTPSPQGAIPTLPGRVRVQREPTQNHRASSSSRQPIKAASAPATPTPTTAPILAIEASNGNGQGSSNGPEKNLRRSNSSKSNPSPLKDYENASVDRTEPPLENRLEVDATDEEAVDGGDENTSKDKKSPKAANRKSPKVKRTEVSASKDGSGVPIAASKPVVADIPSEFKGSISSRAALGSVGLSLLDGPGIIRKKSPSRDIIEEDACPDILEADSSEESVDADEIREASMKFTRIFNAKTPRSFVRASEAASRALEVQASRVILPLARSSSGRRRLGGSVQLPVPQPPSTTSTTSTATTAYSANKQAPAHSPSIAIVRQPQHQIAPTTDPQVDALSNRLAGLHTQPDNKALVKTHSYNQSVSSVTSSVRSHGTDFSGRHSLAGALPAITPSTSSQMSPQPSHAATKRRAHESPAPVLGEGDVIGEGDSTLVTNLLPLDQFPDLFEKLKSEIQWETMYHRGGEVPRLVAVEADVSADGSFPLYRHPNDESPPVLPFSPTVAKIRDYAEREVGHKLNHALIQLYRDGSDHISEHSDKTLDIVQGSKIVNVSFGAQRTMTLRAKRSSTGWEANHALNTGGTHTPSSSVTSLGSETPNPHHTPPPARPAQKIALQHNSMFVLGQRTNAAWLHAIRPDKRSPSLKSTAETAFNGQRISFTFRHIGTFLTPHFPTLTPSDGTYLIYGQGATSKHRETARPIVPGTSPEGEKMLFAFGAENHLSDFSWSQHYGPGFDVLHFGTKPVPIGKLTYTPANNPHARMLKVLFDHINLPVECYPTQSAEDTSDDEIERRMIIFTDNRSNPTGVVTAETASTILAYLNQTVPNINLFPSPAAGLLELANAIGLLGEVLHRIDDLAFMGVPLARNGIIERVTRLDRKVGALLDGPGLGEIGVVQIAIWCLVQECAKGGLRKRGRWMALERVWEMVGEECGVEMM